jgi:trans-2,3-dihydro-3-hydroxyanthranilate isomerase
LDNYGSTPPTFGRKFEDASLIAELLSLHVNDIESGLPLETVSCGVPFLFVPLKSLRAIRKIRFRMDVWEKSFRDFEAPHIFVFTTEVERKASKVHSRMFAPALGIAEDPATGGASGPLGRYLVKNGVLRANPRIEFISEQGFEMGRQSEIKVAIERRDEKISRVSVSGRCAEIGEGTIHI